VGVQGFKNDVFEEKSDNHLFPVLCSCSLLSRRQNVSKYVVFIVFLRLWHALHHLKAVAPNFYALQIH